jgi:hypothetical protein
MAVIYDLEDSSRNLQKEIDCLCSHARQAFTGSRQKPPESAASQFGV